MDARAAADDPELAREPGRAQAEQRALRPELDAGIGGSTRTGSLKCLHAHAAFALARPGYVLGDRILAELPALWPRRLLYCRSSRPMDVELARQHWQDGNRRVERARGDDRALRPARRAQVELVVAELRRRVGQTFTLDELADAYDGADDWARELLDERRPGRAAAGRAGHGRRRRVPRLRARRGRTTAP